MDITELLSSLSEDDMQKLKDTAKNLLGSSNTQSIASSQMPAIDPQILGSIGKVAGLMNRPDPRCDFLMSLKPLLNEDRRGKVDEAVQMLRMMTMLPRIMEMGGIFGTK